MKKIKVILCLLACVLGLTACGQSEEKVLDNEKATAVETITETTVTNCLAVLSPEETEQFTELGSEYIEYVFENYFGFKVDGNAILNSFTSWNNAIAEIGEFKNVVSMNAGYDEQGKDIVVKMNIQGSERTAQVEAIFKDDMYNTLTSLTTNVDYTFGEKMGKAGLNTLMGMGTVFIVLIIIIAVISLFNYIPAITAFFDKNKKKEAVADNVDQAIAQIIEKEEMDEDVTDDLELVAVITAAIAASENNSSTDGYVVRSIRRRPSSQWNRA